MNKSNIEKRDPFTVPENYFDDFQSRILDRIELLHPFEADFPIASLEQPIKRCHWMYAAAAVVLTVLMTLFLTFEGIRGRLENEDGTALRSDFQIPEEAILDYLIMNLDEFDLYYSDLR